MAQVGTRIGEAIKDHRVIVVASALGGVTDLLVRAADATAGGDRSTALDICEKLHERHVSVLSDIDAGNPGKRDH